MSGPTSIDLVVMIPACRILCLFCLETAFKILKFRCLPRTQCTTSSGTGSRWSNQKTSAQQPKQHHFCPWSVRIWSPDRLGDRSLCVDEELLHNQAARNRNILQNPYTLVLGQLRGLEMHITTEQQRCQAEVIISNDFMYWTRLHRWQVSKTSSRPSTEYDLQSKCLPTCTSNVSLGFG